MQIYTRDGHKYSITKWQQLLIMKENNGYLTEMVEMKSYRITISHQLKSSDS